MQRNSLGFFLLLLTACCALCGISARAATPLTINATNLTMPADDPPTTSGGVTSIHMGSSPFTVTGIPGEGTLTIGCQYSGTLTGAIIPRQCGIVGSGQVQVQADETTLSGTVYFVPNGGIVPSLAHLHSGPRPSRRLPVAALALAGALMLGLGCRRRIPRVLFLAAFALCTLAGAVGISACGGGSSSTMTPGSYPYTISAGFAVAGSTAIQTATTTVTLTIQ